MLINSVKRDKMFSFGKTEEEKGRLSAMEENFAVISFEPNGTILYANDNFLNAYRIRRIVALCSIPAICVRYPVFLRQSAQSTPSFHFMFVSFRCCY